MLFIQRGYGFGMTVYLSSAISCISICLDRHLLLQINSTYNYRLSDSVSCIYRKENSLSQEDLGPGPVIHKEKKKGIFSSVIKEFTGSSKENHVRLMETEDTRESIQELSVIFANTNFPCDAENHDNLTMDEDELELNIDDIDLEDRGEKRKERSILGALKKKLAGIFQALKGRLKKMKGINQKISVKEEQQDEKTQAVDQIKKKYGFSSSNETGVAKLAETKLQENKRKLQGINV